jgi:hypothetical protein
MDILSGTPTLTSDMVTVKRSYGPRWRFRYKDANYAYIRARLDSTTPSHELGVEALRSGNISSKSAYDSIQTGSMQVSRSSMRNMILETEGCQCGGEAARALGSCLKG